jgi:hypothetical protein
MTVSPVERPTASAAYGFVRFIGGGLAPYAAGKLAEHSGVHAPFDVGAAAVVVAVGVLATGHSLLEQAEDAPARRSGTPAAGPARHDSLEKQALAEDLGSAG